MKRAKIQCVKVISGLNKRWYFRVKSANGETLAHSETYNSKQACLKGIKALRKAAVFGKVEEYE